MKRWLHKQAVLVWCNWQRLKRGRRPVLRMQKGWRWKPDACPVAYTLGNGWVTQTWWGEQPYIRAATQGQRTPPLVADFIRRFDRREYPELMA